MIKVAIFTGNRAEYGLLHPILRELSADSEFEVYLIISGSHLSQAFGYTATEIDTSGLQGIYEIDLNEIIGQDKIDVLSVFSEVMENGGKIIQDLTPDFVFIAADRYETFAMAVAAYYRNIPVAHIFGGDLSQGGHLDDSVRHCITKLAHLHFATNEDSYKRILGLGEEPWRVFNVGSPVIDNIVAGRFASAKQIAEKLDLDLDKPVILFTQHPVSTESELAYQQVKQTLEALKELEYQTIVTYPCNDPGSEEIIKAIQEYAETKHFRIRKSLGWSMYLGCLRIAACVVGNSSSGLMETPIFKVPCVNIGSRQAGRLRVENVLDVPYDINAVKNAVIKALTDKTFLEKVKSCSNPYGEGGTAKKVARLLKDIPRDNTLLQKKMTY